MSCGQVRQFLDAWLDGELDAATSQEIAAHIHACPDCLAMQAEREALAARIRQAAPRNAAPDELLPRVLRRLREAKTEPEAAGSTFDIKSQPATTSWLAGVRAWWPSVALAAASSAASVVLTLLLVGAPAQPPVPQANLTDELVSRHVASLAGPLIEVASSDRHTIKPWFHGKVPFAPAVRDLSAKGFVLKGARLEHIAGSQAAAVVYQIRNHPINLFVWRASVDTPAALQMSEARGFALAAWRAQGLHFAALSDVDPRDLERFAQEISAAR